MQTEWPWLDFREWGDLQTRVNTEFSTDRKPSPTKQRIAALGGHIIDVWSIRSILVPLYQCLYSVVQFFSNSRASCRCTCSCGTPRQCYPGHHWRFKPSVIMATPRLLLWWIHLAHLSHTLIPRRRLDESSSWFSRGKAPIIGSHCAVFCHRRSPEVSAFDSRGHILKKSRFCGSVSKVMCQSWQYRWI